MRIPITFDKPLGLLIDEISEPAKRRATLKTLVDNFICEDSSTFKEAISTASNSETKAILSDIKELLCWKTVDEDQEAIKLVVAESNLADALFTDEIYQAIDNVGLPIRSGQTRISGFQQKFQEALSRANRVEIIDGFAASNLMQLSEGTVWFITKILENFSGVLSIYSREPESSVNAPGGVNGKRDLLLTNLKKIVKPVHQFKGELRVTLVDREFILHNRRLALRFDNGQATILLEKGLGTFDDDPFREAYEFKNADLVEFKKVISTAANSRSKHDMSVRHEAECVECDGV